MGMLKQMMPVGSLRSLEAKTDEWFNGKQHEQGDEPPDIYRKDLWDEFHDNEHKTHGASLGKFDVPDIEPLHPVVHGIKKFHRSPPFSALHTTSHNYNCHD